MIVDAGYIGYDATKVTDASLNWNLRGPDHYSSGEVTKMFETFDHGILESGQWNFCVYGQIELDDGHMMEDHQCSQILVSIPFSHMSHHDHGHGHEIHGQFTLFGTFDGEYKDSEDSDEGMPEYPEYNLTLRISDDTDQILTYQMQLVSKHLQQSPYIPSFSIKLRSKIQVRLQNTMYFPTYKQGLQPLYLVLLQMHPLQ